MTSSVDAAALVWRPPSPYEYTLVREIMTLSMRHMSSDEYRLVRVLLEEYDGDGGDDEICLAMMSQDSIRELLYSVRRTIGSWLEGETTAHWTDIASLTKRDRPAKKKK